MDISARECGETLIVHVHQDRIDAASAIQFKDRLRELGRLPGNPVVLDLSQVQFMDSSGLGAVVAVMKMLGPERRLELSGLTPTVMKVFRLTRMDSIFVLHDCLPVGLRDAG